MSGPRVLFVIPGEARGSSMVFARRQARTLQSRGVRVECFHLRSRTSPATLTAEFRRFSALRRTFCPDVIHAHFGTVTGLFAVLAAAGTPVMITFRGSDLNRVPTSRGLRAFLGRVFSQLSALRAGRIICVSQGLKEALLWGQDRVTVLPSGVDTDLFKPVPRSEARTQLGWPRDGSVVLFNSGHDARNKRLDLARSAFDQVQQEIQDARLEILDGAVPPDRVPLIMNAADCLLVTSDSEGSPTVVQEAIATNLPVVSVDVGDVAERLKGIEACAIAPREPSALASAVIAILRKGTRSSGRVRAREVCSTRIADELTHLYREVVAHRSPQSFASWNTTLSSR